MLRKVPLLGIISIHALLAESDCCTIRPRLCNVISIHALLAESDLSMAKTSNADTKFLSTLSLRRATQKRFLVQSALLFLSTLSLRRATDGSKSSIEEISISIHALLAESDCCTIRPRLCNVISIHALLAESDGPMKKGQVYYIRFLSTLSLRRATRGIVSLCAGISNFYPRSPCGERQGHVKPIGRAPRISIHALLAESDPPVRDIIQWEGIFLSTLSLRRATAGSYSPE